MKKAQTWRKLYKLAAELYRLAPWQYMEETDIFAVKSSHSGKSYFISIMGSDGTFRALSAYEEPLALGQFWDLNENASVDSGDVLTIPHMMLSFDSEQETEPEQLQQIHELGTDFGFREEWPEFKKIVPAYFPVIPQGSSLDDFAEILIQSLEVCERAMNDIDFIHPDDKGDDVYLFREYSGKEDHKSWGDKYRKVKIPKIPYKVTYKQKDLDELISLPKGQGIFQAHYQMLPLPLKVEEDVICFPFMAIMTNKRTGFIEGHFLLTPTPDYYAVLSSIPYTMIGFVIELGFKPRSIEVKIPLLYEMLNEPFRKCGIPIVLTNKLESAEKAIEGMIENARKGGEGK